MKPPKLNWNLNTPTPCFIWPKCLDIWINLRRWWDVVVLVVAVMMFVIFWKILMISTWIVSRILPSHSSTSITKQRIQCNCKLFAWTVINIHEWVDRSFISSHSQIHMITKPGQEWAKNCVTLSTFYCNRNNFRQAEHLLQAAAIILPPPAKSVILLVVCFKLVWFRLFYFILFFISFSFHFRILWFILWCGLNSDEDEDGQRQVADLHRGWGSFYLTLMKRLVFHLFFFGLFMIKIMMIVMKLCTSHVAIVRWKTLWQNKVRMNWNHSIAWQASQHSHNHHSSFIVHHSHTNACPAGRATRTASQRWWW